jgi:hypothetical protein
VAGSHRQHRNVPKRGLSMNRGEGSRPFNEVTTIGLDLAKSVFQVSEVDWSGELAVRRQFVRHRAVHRLPLV